MFDMVADSLISLVNHLFPYHQFHKTGTSKIGCLIRDSQLVLSTTSNPKGITWIRGSNIEKTTSILEWKVRLITKLGTKGKTSLLKSTINVDKETLGKKSKFFKCKMMEVSKQNIHTNHHLLQNTVQ